MMTNLTPLTGEPLGLDFVNTRARAGTAESIDFLATPDGLRAWIALQAERLSDFQAPALETISPADLAVIQAVRAHAADAIENARRGDAPPGAALRGLNQALAAAPLHMELQWTGEAVSVLPKRASPVAARLAACLAEAVANVLSDPLVGTIRECAADDCTMLFVPANSRRHWCSASRCGNRMRVARYYKRHKGG